MRVPLTDVVVVVGMHFGGFLERVSKDLKIGREFLRLTAAGLLSTVKRTAKTASAIPSLSMLPSHSISTSPLF